MTARTAPGPLVVAAFTVYCDRQGHEVTVTTDGLRVAASANRQAFTSAVWRDGSTYTICCDVLDRHDEPCPGTVTVDTAEHGSWRPATADDHLTLNTDAQQVHQ